MSLPLKLVLPAAFGGRSFPTQKRTIAGTLDRWGPGPGASLAQTATTATYQNVEQAVSMISLLLAKPLVTQRILCYSSNSTQTSNYSYHTHF